MGELGWSPYETAFGPGWLGWDPADGGLRRTRLPGAADDSAAVPSPPPSIRDLRTRLVAYFAGSGPLPWDPGFAIVAARSPLDEIIYRVVGEIPAGSTMTYRDVANAAGRPGAARAVGAAMARNPLAPLVPCHRVVGSDGSLRGYAGGITMKQYLLAVESSHV